jgi:transposase-like protein
MIPKEFQEYFQESIAEVQQTILNSLLGFMDSSAEISSQSDRPLSCPHCESKKIRANGKLKQVQRYVCVGCGKNFSETTGKVWYNLKKKDKMNTYMFCLLSGYSIRKSAKETGISIQTSFDWRHKLLSSFSSVWVEGFEGICESDDLFFLQSEKGNRDLERKPRKRGGKAIKRGISNEQVAVIASCDRSGNKDMKVATMGRISKKDIAKVLDGKLSKVETLCSDSHRSYTAFAKSEQLEHKKFNASKGQRIKDKVYHVQNVNNMDMRLRKWMEKFNGVATKYLQNYLNWFLVLEKVKNSTSKLQTMATIALTSSSVWWEFKDLALNNMLLRT